MQRKATKQSPAANTAECAFLAYTKGSDCICCGAEGPSIVDHIWGSSKKLYIGPERVLVGHWAVIPLCVTCDNVKTRGSRRAFEDQFGSQSFMWMQHINGILTVPGNVVAAISIESAKEWESE